MDFEGNVLGWIRQSSDSQHSKASQLSAFEAFCEQNHFSRVQSIAFTGSAMSNDPTIFFDEMRKQGITAYDEYKNLIDSRAIDFIWAITPSRYGRSKWLYNYMVQYAIDNGARVYAEGVGVINEANFDAMVALTSIGSQADVKRLHGARALQTRLDNMARGIPPKGFPWTHEEIRNEKGKLSGIKIKPDARLPMRLATEYLLDGRSYREISERMTRAGYKHFAAHHHVRRIFYNPILHGHIGYRHQRQSAIWLFEDGHTIPDGVYMAYHVLPPLWDAETHPHVIHELKKRLVSNKGSSNRYRTKNPLLKLVKCGGCGANMNYHQPNGRWEYLRCQKQCGAKLIRLDQVIAYIDTLLRIAIDKGYVSLVNNNNETGMWRQKHDAIQKDIDRVDQLITGYLEMEVKRPEYADRYAILIDDETKNIKLLKSELAKLKQAKPVNPMVAQTALSDLKEMTLEAFWVLEPREINGILHRLLVNRRVYVTNGGLEMRYD